MTDSTKDFVDGLREEYGEPGPDNSHPMAPWGGGLLEKGVEYGGAFARGALKQAALAPGIRNIEPQAILDYAHSKDPAHPDVEGYGRYVTPGAVMLRGLPDLPALAYAQKAYDAGNKAIPWIARAGSNFAQNIWKGGFGGAAEADTDTKTGGEAATNVARGTAEGVGTAAGLTAGQGVLRALPHWMMPAAIAGAELAHGHFLPWHIRHAIAAGLASVAARAARIPAGLIGAGGEAASQRGGYEAGGGQEQQESPEPF